jgi:uncharacterized protein (DUF2147 family)
MSTAFLAIALIQVAPALSIDGLWINPARSVIIRIAPCGEARCGTVEWASAEAQADAKKNAPTLVGTQLLTDLNPSTTTAWKGKLFIPDRNVRASAKIAVQGADSIKVSGCALGGILCDSQLWARTDSANP